MKLLKKNNKALIELLRTLQAQSYRFITTTPTSHALVNARLANKKAQNTAGIFGWSRPFGSETIDKPFFESMQAANILTTYENLWKSRLRVSSIGDHLFLHSAFPTTDKEAVFFGPDTYRFANAIHQFLASNAQPLKRAVDICTGSGAGAILLAHALQEAEIIGVDINEQALELAEVNAVAADLKNVLFKYSDLLKNVEGRFDLIIANPPYLVDDSMRTYCHGGNLSGAELSLAIVETAIERLESGGALLLYTGVSIIEGQDLFYAQASAILAKAGFEFTYKEIDPDIFGEELVNPLYKAVDRIAAVLLTARKSVD